MHIHDTILPVIDMSCLTEHEKKSIEIAKTLRNDFSFYPEKRKCSTEAISTQLNGVDKKDTCNGVSITILKS
jgi:hypothetical protein